MYSYTSKLLYKSGSFRLIENRMLSAETKRVVAIYRAIKHGNRTIHSYHIDAPHFDPCKRWLKLLPDVYEAWHLTPETVDAYALLHYRGIPLEYLKVLPDPDYDPYETV